MSLTDPISNALTMIRNALRAKKETVDIPNSNMVRSIVEILKNEGYIENIKLMDYKSQGLIRVYLKYIYDKPAIRNLQRVSKPSLRVYKSARDKRRVLGGLGIAILSTSQGIMTDKQAREKKIGGEVICRVW